MGQMGNLTALIKRAGELWRRLTLWQRISLAAAGAGLLAGLLLLGVGTARGPAYAPLFSDLGMQDAAEVTEALDADQIPYRLAQNGQTVLVPTDSVHQIRLRLAGQGLPSGGVVGFEIMDRNRFGASEFDRRMDYQRALQGELARTIQQIEGVRQARVHIVIPEETLFVAEAETPSAAVMLRLQAGASLEPDSTRGILHLVSHSVDGLRPEDVTIIDQFGRVISDSVTLAESAPETASGATLLRLETQSRLEEELRNSLQGLLTQVFGPGNVVARVNAELSFDQKVVERDLFQPVVDDDGLVRSVQQLEEHFSGSAAAAGGVPGVSGNVPGYAAAAETGPSTYDRTETTSNLEMNEIREHTVIAPGSVSRLSVAVVVNREALTPAEQQAIEQTVASAIGYDEARQDQISVLAMQFDTTVVDQLREVTEAEVRAARWRVVERLILVGALAAVILAVGAGVVRMIRKRQEWLAEERRRAAYEAVTRAEREVSVTKTRARQEIEKLAQTKPEQVAQLIRSWALED